MMQKKEGFKGQQTVVLPKSITEQIANDPLVKELFITDIGFYPHAEFHYRKRRKGATGNIIIFCVEGLGWYETNGEIREIRKNDVCIIPAGFAHSYGADPLKPWTIYWMHIEGSKADKLAGELPFTIHLDNEDPELYLQRLRLFDEIFTNISITYNLRNIEYANMLVWNFLITIFYHDLYAKKNISKSEKLIDRSLVFMRNNLNKNLGLNDLAAHSGLSVSQYSILFKKKTSTSPMNFYAQLKIQQSVQLLENQQKRIKEIALELGFEDQFYFSRLFTKTMGLSPAKFRKTLYA